MFACQEFFDLPASGEIRAVMGNVWAALVHLNSRGWRYAGFVDTILTLRFLQHSTDK